MALKATSNKKKKPMPASIKKPIADFVKAEGGTCQYAGKTKTMHIHGPNREELINKIIKRFGRHIAIKIA